MRLKVLNRLKLNRTIASKYPGSAPELEAWLQVCPREETKKRPYQPAPEETRRNLPKRELPLGNRHQFPADTRYWVRLIEARKEGVEKLGEFLDEELHLTRDDSWYLKNLEDLRVLLDALLDDTDSLDAPWYCDYPNGLVELVPPSDPPPQLNSAYPAQREGASN